MNTRMKSATGLATADAFGESIEAGEAPATGCPAVPTTAAGSEVTGPSRSRRAPAATAHTNGAATGTSSVPRASSHETTSAPASRGSLISAETLSGDTAADARALLEPAALPGEPAETERPPRASEPEERRRSATRAESDLDGAADAESCDELAEPASPEVSANATGIQATTEPTPSTAANRPTRPTARALTDSENSPDTAAPDLGPTTARARMPRADSAEFPARRHTIPT